jgi:shikimate kinase
MASTPASAPASGPDGASDSWCSRRVVLIGLRASGKSSVAALLATRLGVPSVDLDDRTRVLSNCATVREAFAALGEARFRELEADALRAALAEPPSVLALGGGTPTAPGAAELLQSARAEGRAFLVFLDPPLDALARRLSADAGDRPSLTGRGVVEEISEIAARRRGPYAALAELVLREDLAPDALADRIEAALRRG